MPDRRHTVDRTFDRDPATTTLGDYPTNPLGGAFPFYIPPALYPDITLHALSNPLVGHAGDPVDCRYRCPVENTQTCRIPFRSA